MIYLDAGCLVKLFYPEPESRAVAAMVAGEMIIFTGLHELEMTTAFQLKRFRQEATAEQAEAALRLTRDDLESGKLARVAVDWVIAFRRATEVARDYASANGCRSLDVLHCALANVVKAEEFVSTDVRQIAMAKSIGLRFRKI